MVEMQVLGMREAFDAVERNVLDPNFPRSRFDPSICFR